MVKKKTEDSEKTKETAPTFYQAVGRRKEATARVRLYLATTKDKMTIGDKEYQLGQLVVNNRLIEEYFPGEVAHKMFTEPFRTTNTLDRFVTSIKVEGGGLSGQLGAVIHGIARALEKIDKLKYRPTLKKHGFLKRDPRAKERRKAGFAHKARKRKQSPKR